MNTFTQIEIDLHQGDVIYMFSDGYADQFGGQKGKKFKYRPLKQLLIDNSNKSMKQQRYILSHTFSEWKGDLEQIDDVCVIGIKPILNKST